MAGTSSLYSAVCYGSELLYFNHDIVSPPSVLAKADGGVVLGV